MDHNSHFFGENGAVEFSLVSALYNEEKSVGQLLAGLDEVFRNTGRSYELVIVDDGSTDGSLQTLKDQIGPIKNLRVVELYKNKGQVAALGAGMSVARGQWIIMMDGDLQHDAENITRFIELSDQGHDLVASYRQTREEKLMRKMITAVSNRLNRYIVGIQIKDFGSAFRMIHSDVVKAITDSQGCVRYNTPEIYKNARNLIEIPITQHRRPYGSSKWSLLDFILFNLDLITASSRLTQIILFISGLGLLTGVALYFMHIFGVFAEVSAISAPVSIAFTSFSLAILAVIWREVIEVMKIAKGVPPFLISAIWSDGVADCDQPVKN